MEIKPVGKIEKPNYPLKEEINAEQLKASIPKRWASSSAAKIALGTLAAVTLAGCTPEIRTAGVPEPSGVITESGIAESPELSMFVGVPTPAALNVAPLFEHGNGRGSFGCVMVAPPVFLSEEDALMVINEAAKEYGLTFSMNGAPEFYDVLQPQPNLFPWVNEPSPSTKSPDKLMTLKTDFVETNHNIAIEFVSTDDVISWGKPSDASVEVYETKATADELSESLDNATGFGYTAAVLYDPCEEYQPKDLADRKAWDEADRKARELSEAQLAAQAKDFFEWLRQQGII